MRRQFNQDLIPLKLPEKYTQLPKKKQKPTRKTPELSKLLRQLIKAAGSDYNQLELARVAIVKPGTVQSWMNNRPIGRFSHSLVAKYFSRVLNRPYKEIYNSIVAAYNIKHD